MRNRRLLSKALLVAVLGVTLLGAMMIAAPAAGAATCKDGVATLNLGQGCASVLGVPVIQSSTGGTACADSAGCGSVHTSTPTAPTTPRVMPQEPPPAKRPQHHTYVRKSVAPPQAASYRINAADLDTAFFYSGSFSRTLPYPAFRSDIFSPGSTLRVRPSLGSGTHLDLGPFGRNVALSLLAGLMLIVSAGGVRRLLSGV